jgi:PAS domain S-box-containing protein
MFKLDQHTALLSYVLVCFISLFAIVLLLRQYRSRYKGIDFMFLCFSLQIIALTLILFRGIIPSYISFDVANFISAAGIIAFCLGFEEYIGKKSSLALNIVLLSAFSVVHIWISFPGPDLEARHISISYLWLIILIEGICLLFFNLPKSKIKSIFPVSLVCIAFFIVAIIRIVRSLLIGYNLIVFSDSSTIDTVMILVSQLLLILLVYGLDRMFGRRLLFDMKIEEEKFSKAFKTSPYAIMLSRLSDGKIIEVNKGFVDQSGYSFSDLYGKKSIDLNFWDSEEDRNSFIAELLNSGRILRREMTIKKKSGEIITILFSADVIGVNDEMFLFTSFDNITDRKIFEKELLESRMKAEESDKLKTAFLHNISHEIRTPLNAIVGFSAMLGFPDTNETDRDSFIEIINKSSDNLLSVVSNIIEISNIEAGILRFNRSDVNLNSLMDELYEKFNPLAIENGIEFSISLGLSSQYSYFQCDKIKLIQVLSSVLQNAFKFTTEGSIQFGYKLKNCDLEFYISDTGIGIPTEEYEKIFDRFYKIDNSKNKSYGGTGLGLSISKAYVELCGGKMWVTSVPNFGTTVYFTLPYIKVVKNSADVDQNEIKRNMSELFGKTILIVENTENNFSLFQQYLSETGINFIYARNGWEAIEYCRKPGIVIDMLIMDVKMPVMDGDEALTEIRRFFPSVAAIAQIAFSNEINLKKLLDNSFTDYLTKPYTQNDLLKIIYRYL